jgi:Leucine-rich repeat (LRR) protein
MYNLGHLGLYKNVPKKRMFNPTPDYDRDAYTLLQYKSHLRNEFLIPLKANGNGSGVATIRLQSLETQSIKITGNGKFYTDSAGTTELGTESTIGTSLTSLYVKVPAGESCYLVCGKADKLSGLGDRYTNVIADGVNTPYINYCAINYPLISLSSIRFNAVLNSSFTGSIDNTPNLVRLVFDNNLLSSFTGSIDNTPNLVSISFDNNLLTAFTGSIDNTPNLVWLTFYSNLLTALTGDIGKIVKCYYFRPHINTNCTFTYVTRRNNWTSAYDTLWVSCSSMTSTMVDNLLIDLDASGVAPTGVKLIRLDGLCGAVTSASATARASLISKGFTVVVNT